MVSHGILVQPSQWDCLILARGLERTNAFWLCDCMSTRHRLLWYYTIFKFCPFLQKNVQSSEILRVRRLACIISRSQVSKIGKYTRKPYGRAGVARGFGSVARVAATTSITAFTRTISTAQIYFIMSYHITSYNITYIYHRIISYHRLQ